MINIMTKPRYKTEEDINLFPRVTETLKPVEENPPNLDGWDIRKVIKELAEMQPCEPHEAVNAPLTGGIALATEADGVHHHVLTSDKLRTHVVDVLRRRGRAKSSLADDITLRLFGLHWRDTSPNSPTTMANLRREDWFNAARADVMDKFPFLRLRWLAEPNSCKRLALIPLIECWKSQQPSIFDLEPLSAEKFNLVPFVRGYVEKPPALPS